MFARYEEYLNTSLSRISFRSISWEAEEYDLFI